MSKKTKDKAEQTKPRREPKILVLDQNGVQIGGDFVLAEIDQHEEFVIRDALLATQEEIADLKSQLGLPIDGVYRLRLADAHCLEQENQKLKHDLEIQKSLTTVSAEEVQKLTDENKKYREEMDKITNGIPSEWAYAMLKKERDQLKKELHDYQIGSYVETKAGDEARAEVNKLTAQLDEAKAALEFYASALELDESKAPFGEPNIDPFLMPARLGTRAKEVLERIKK